ncbi:MULTISPECIES: helix-turn-helix domain-containing protein [unclassified Microbacterium]|uniref:helix-turn-helix domain-containing protein n=1 Tax=unclassified Microbacterium TaxID=2609290 RepID=UPI003417ACC0
MTMMTAPGQIPEWTIADRLRKARESAGYGQADFAARTSMARATISAAENGHRVPSRANMRLWALATGVPFEWIETGNVPTDPVGPAGIEPTTSTV